MVVLGLHTHSPTQIRSRSDPDTHDNLSRKISTGLSNARQEETRIPSAMPDVTDPKEKKKIQNRIAQRTHREKLKRRMQELEQIAAERDSGTSSATGSVDLLGNDKRSSWPMPVSPGTTCYSILSPTSPASNHSAVSSTVRRPSQGSHVGQARSMSTPRTKSPWTEYFSDAGNPYSMEKTHGEATQSRANRTSSGPKSFQAFGSSATSVDTDWPVLGRTPAQEDVSENTFENSTSFGVENPFSWTVPASQDHLLENIRHIVGADHLQLDSERPEFPAKTAPVSDRLRCLKQCAEELGFGSLDAAVSAYYTADLNDCPALHNERSLGRNRRLPTLLSDIQASSHSWNMWEQTGFKQEILKAAEHFYVEECGRVCDVASILGEKTQTEVTSEHLAKAHQALQNTFPNLWALLTGLAMNTANKTGKRQHPYTVFSILVMLCYPGKALPPEVIGWNDEGPKLSSVEF